jgi:hypothetical protein
MDHLTMTQSLHIARIRASNSIGLLENYAHPHREPFPTFEELRGAVNELDSIIHTIKMLDFYEPDLEVIPTETQRHALGTIEALLTNCAETLDAFTEKVRRFITSWESADPAGQDGLKPYMQSRFERNDIAALGGFVEKLHVRPDDCMASPIQASHHYPGNDLREDARGSSSMLIIFSEQGNFGGED